MVLYSIHEDIFLTPNHGYEYIKHYKRFTGETATLYNLTENNVTDYLKKGYKKITVGNKNVIYKNLK